MMNKIVKKFSDKLEGYVEGRHIKLQWAPTLVKFPEEEGFDEKMEQDSYSV